MSIQELRQALEIGFNTCFFTHYLLKTQYYDLIDLAHALKAHYVAVDLPSLYGQKIAMLDSLIDQLDALDVEEEL